MSFPPPPPLPPTLPCKVCGAPAKRFSVVDFAKHCSHTPWETQLPIGVPVLFYRCTACSLIFTTFFDAWTQADFSQHVYNDDYIRFDGDYVENRPRGTADLVAKTFPRRDLRVLDYGGGSGATAKFLNSFGFTDVTVFEPFNPTFAARPTGKFDLIVCVEVLEHSTDPKAITKDLLSFLNEDGMVLMTTLMQDQGIDAAKGEHWYLSPRNGHTLFHSAKSLETCFGTLGYHVAHANHNLHLAFRNPPPLWARHLFGQPTGQPAAR